MREEAIVEFGGQKWTASLDFQQIQALLPVILEIMEFPVGKNYTPEQLDTYIDVIEVALSRHHPELTREELEDRMEAGKADPIVGQILQMVVTFWKKHGIDPKHIEIAALLKKLTKERSLN